MELLPHLQVEAVEAIEVATAFVKEPHPTPRTADVQGLTVPVI